MTSRKEDKSRTVHPSSGDSKKIDPKNRLFGGQIMNNNQATNGDGSVQIRESDFIFKSDRSKIKVTTANGELIPFASLESQKTSLNGDSISFGPIDAKVNTSNGKSLSFKQAKPLINTAIGKPVKFEINKVKISTTKSKSESNPAYLTKRILKSVTKKAFTEAAEETMDVMGYNLVAKDGWLVKVYKDGHFEKIGKLKAVPGPPSGKFFD